MFEQSIASALRKAFPISPPRAAQLNIEVACKRPFWRSPIFTVGMPKDGAS